ncbi:MAG: FdhF/YdeP family oxidoreductase [Phycisphaerae bacterium]
MKRPTHGGGFQALRYSLRMARRAGGAWKFYQALRSKNACKTCALGMGGQSGGMVNEHGGFPEVCKKSMQAMVADMQGRIRPEFFQKYAFAELRSLTPRELEACGRLNDPLYAGPGDTHYRPITWDEAMDRCVARLKAALPDRNFFYFSGRASNEAAFLWQVFARLYGTNNVNNCSYYCHQASGVGLRDTLGTATATVSLDDVEKCDLFILIGANPSSNHPRLMASLDRLRRRGGKVIVINPLREVGLVNFRVPSSVRSMLFGSPIASQYLQPHIGGDIALLCGMAKHLCEMEVAHWDQPVKWGHHEDDAATQQAMREAAPIAASFVESSCEHYDAWVEHLAATDWETIERDSGVTQREIEDAAFAYAHSKATIFGWTMGITHHEHGVDNVRAIVNLALMRGMVGKPGAGLLPIRGHSNVQGVGSVGVVPQLSPPMVAALERELGVKLPTTPGVDTLAGLETMNRGEIQNLWALGGNLYGASPDAKWTEAAFAKAESVVYVSTTLNTGHAWGRGRETLILPAKARDEESQATTQESMFNFVRLSDGGPARLPGPRSEVELVAEMGKRILGPESPLDWREMERHVNIRKLIAAVVPGYGPLGQIDATKKEFEIAGRVMHAPAFNTASGKAQFRVPKLPDLTLPAADAPDAIVVRLATIRSEGQFNTVVYEDEDIYRGVDRRDVILLHADDLRRLGIRENDRVTVRSSAGEMRGIHARGFDIRACNAAMYGPEANVLIPRVADRESKTPAFKNIRITVIAERGTASGMALPVV